MLIIASCRTQNCPYSENLFVFDFSTVHIGISIIIERLMAPLFNVSPPIIAMCCMNAACRYFLSFFFLLLLHHATSDASIEMEKDDECESVTR